MAGSPRDIYKIAIDLSGTVTIDGKPGEFFLMDLSLKPKNQILTPLKSQLVIQPNEIRVGDVHLRLQDLQSISTRLEKSARFVTLKMQGDGQAAKELILAVYDGGFNRTKPNQKIQNVFSFLLDYVTKTRENTASAQMGSRLARLKKLVQVSRTLKISQMAQILDMSEKELYQRIIDWAAEYGFTLDQDVVDFGSSKKDSFVAELDKSFAEWGKSAATKAGKV